MTLEAIKIDVRKWGRIKCLGCVKIDNKYVHY